MSTSYSRTSQQLIREIKGDLAKITSRTSPHVRDTLVDKERDMTHIRTIVTEILWLINELDTQV